MVITCYMIYMSRKLLGILLTYIWGDPNGPKGLVEISEDDLDLDNYLLHVESVWPPAVNKWIIY